MSSFKRINEAEMRTRETGERESKVACSMKYMNSLFMTLNVNQCCQIIVIRGYFMLVISKFLQLIRLSFMISHIFNSILYF